MNDAQVLALLITVETRVDERTTLAAIDVLDRQSRIPMEPWAVTMLCRALRERLAHEQDGEAR